MIDLASLLVPVPGPDPCGPNLEYDPQFLDLERAARREREQRLGAALRPAVAPDWRQVERLGTALLPRTKDWRVARLLLQAWLAREGLAGLTRGLQLWRELAGRFGEAVHPRGDDSYYDNGRCHNFDVELLELTLEMAGEDGVVEQLRELRFGIGPRQVSAREVERAVLGDPIHDATCAAVQEAAAVDPRMREQLAESLDAAVTFNAWFRQVSYRDAPLEELARVLERLQAAARPVSGWVLETTAPGPAKPAEGDARPVRKPEWNLEAFVAPLYGDEPCGPNLEHDNLSRELDEAVRGRPELRFGSFVSAGEPADWTRVERLAIELLSRSRDLRVAIALTRAATGLRGIEGTAAGLQLIARLLATHGMHLHPAPDPDDQDPLWERRVALATLDADDGLVGDLNGLLWGDADAGSGQRAVGDEPALRTETLLSVAQAQAAIQAIRREMAPHGDPKALPLGRLLGTLQRLHDMPMPMPGWDLEALVTPLSAEEPCGPNLEYDNLSLELDGAIRGRPEQRFGSVVSAGAPVDWARVERLAIELLSRSRDLRAAIALTRAATCLHGIEGTAFGLQLIARLLATQGTHLHPVPDQFEEDPLWERRIALAALDADDGLVGDLGRLLWGDGADAVSGRQLDEAIDPSALEGLQQALADEVVRCPPMPVWVAQAYAAAESIARAAAPLSGSDAAPLNRLLAALRRRLDLLEALVSARSAPVVGSHRTEPADDPSLRDTIRLVLERLVASTETAHADLDCARAQRLTARRFSDIERGLVREQPPGGP